MRQAFYHVFFAWLFMRIIWAPYIESDLATEYIAGMILLGIAPCTPWCWSGASQGLYGFDAGYGRH